MGANNSLLSSPSVKLNTWSSSKHCGGALVQSYRTTMEDVEFHVEKFIFPTWTLLGVLDGHGGKSTANFVKEHFVSILSKNIRDDFAHEFEDFVEPSMDYIQEAFSKTYFEVDKLYRAKSQDSTTGACCVVCLITSTKILTSWCGDCAAFLIQKDFQKIPLTIDHSPDLPQEKERIQKADYVVYNGRIDGTLNVARSFGDFFLKPIEKERTIIKDGKKRSFETIRLTETTFPIVVTPDFKIIDRTENDFMLCLCSDGLTKTFNTWNDVIAAKYKLGCYTPHQYATLIVDDCIKRKGLDNVTFSVWINPSHSFTSTKEEREKFLIEFDEYKKNRRKTLKPCTCDDDDEHEDKKEEFVCEFCENKEDDDEHEDK